MRPALAIAIYIFGSGACKQPSTDQASARGVYDREHVPPSLSAPVATAERAIRSLEQRLSKRLLSELGRAGPVAAIGVCRDEADEIARAVATAAGVAVGRTSHRLRSVQNAPREWVKPLVRRAASGVGESRPVVVDLGGRVGVLRPIVTRQPCLTCHGPRRQIAPAVLDALKRSYPSDRAVGFRSGDLRGFFWAEAPK